MKLLPRRVREVILRCFCLIIKSQSLLEIRSLLLSLFIVITNETDGEDLDTKKETPCEQQKNILIQAASTGIIDFQNIFDDIMSENDECIILLKEYEKENEGLESMESPFESWVKNVYNESKIFIREGSGINAMFSPNLVPYILKSIKLLPLWSGIMIPIFGYGKTTSSSAAIESSLKKLKTITFKHIEYQLTLKSF